MVVNELKKFENKTLEELTQIRNEMKEVCMFNQNHYNVLFKQKYNEGINLDLSKIFDEIWEELKK
jgi:Zn-dependent M32 family carboxypeptidase